MSVKELEEALAVRAAALKSKQIKLKDLDLDLDEDELIEVEDDTEIEYEKEPSKEDEEDEYGYRSRGGIHGKIMRATAVISLQDDELKIIKNRQIDGLKNLDENTAVDFISKIIASTVIKNNPTLKLFQPTIEEDAREECKKLLNSKWGIEVKKELDFEDAFDEAIDDDVPF